MARSSPRIDSTRRLLGGLLIGLLVAIVLFGFAALIWIQAAAERALIQGAQAGADITKLTAAARLAAEQSKADADRLALLLNIVFGPVAALAGSVTGFYFGRRKE
jgi:hypothetical protein